MRFLIKFLKWCGFKSRFSYGNEELYFVIKRTPKTFTQANIDPEQEKEAIAKPRTTDRVFGKIKHCKDVDKYVLESRKDEYRKVAQRYEESLKL